MVPGDPQELPTPVVALSMESRGRIGVLVEPGAHLYFSVWGRMSTGSTQAFGTASARSSSQPTSRGGLPSCLGCNGDVAQLPPPFPPQHSEHNVQELCADLCDKDENHHFEVKFHEKYR